MIECKQCSQKIPQEAKFCPFCRGKVGEAGGKDNPNFVLLSDDESDRVLDHNVTASPSNSLRNNFNFGLFFKKYWFLLLIGWIIIANVFNKGSSQSSSSTSGYTRASSTSSYNPSAKTSSNYVKEGDYYCSQYQQSQINTLRPSVYEESSIKLQQQAMQERSNEIDSFQAEINAMNVTEYSSQELIDEYNSKIRDHNAKLVSYKADVSVLSDRIDRFNTAVNEYNNYLITNCHK